MDKYNIRIQKLSEIIDDAVCQAKNTTVVIGNGFQYIPILSRDDLIKHDILVMNNILTSKEKHRLSECDPSSWEFIPLLNTLTKKYDKAIQQIGLYLDKDTEERIVWQTYEIWRKFTRELSQLEHHYGSLAYLIDKKVLNSIITTNYDLMLETLFNVCNAYFPRNPCLQKGEKYYDNYYSVKTDKEVSCYWKIHGDLAYMSCESYRSDNVSKVPEGMIYPYKKLNGNNKLYFRHYHDYGNFPRARFNREIQAVKNYLKKATTSLIIVLGFRGDYNPKTGTGEELAELLVELAKQGLPVYTLVRPNKYITGSYSYLWESLDKMNSAIQPPRNNLEKTVGEMLTESLLQVAEFEDFETYTKQWYTGLMKYQERTDTWLAKPR